jgi:hypothetical protein
MVDIDYSLWNSGAATGHRGENHEFTDNRTTPHQRLNQDCG